jgi:ABC-2 type transport system permease protein
LLERGARPAGWADASAAGATTAGSAQGAIPRLVPAERWGPVQFLIDVLTISDSELRKLRHDPYELVTRALQPVLWLLIFGQVLAEARAIPTGNLPYLDFLAPGVLAQSALFASIFYGMATIWERDLGVVHTYLVSPVTRAALVSGKAFSAGLRSLSQAAVVYVLSGVLGVNVRWDLPALAGVVVVIVVGSALFATFSLIIACIVRSRERFMGIGQVMTMPLFFASSAIYPVAVMPEWLKVLAVINPLTYMVDGLRQLMIVNGPAAAPLWVDLAVLGGWTVGLLAIGTRVYPRLAQ